VQTAYQGTTVGHIYEKNRVFAVAVILPPEERTRVSTIADLPLRNAAGAYVFLREVADIRETSGRYEVLHLNGRRVQTVTCNVAGGATEAFVAQAKKRIQAATARRGAAERLAPILMTALVTGLGLLPLVIGLHTAGREIEGPVALVILGGLITSTTLNLLVLPTLAAYWGRFPGPKPGEGG